MDGGERRGLSAAMVIVIVLLVIIAAAFSFSVGQHAVRLVTLTQTTVSLSMVTTTEVSTSTVTVTTTPPDYFQVSAVALYSGSATSRTAQGTANLEFSVTGPQITGTVAAIIAIDISNSTSSTFPNVFQCSSSTTCSQISEVVVKESGTMNFNTPTSAFYIGTAIDNGVSYDYNIIFSNGNSVEGSVMAS